MVEPLLILQISVDGDKHVAAPVKQVEQLPIVGVGPPKVTDGRSLWPVQRAEQRPWDAIIEDDPHAQPALGLRGRRLGVERHSRQLEYGYGVFAAHRRECLEERIERVPGLEVLDKRLDWNSCPGKHRLAAQAVRGASNQRVWDWHDSKLHVRRPRNIHQQGLLPTYHNPALPRTDSISACGS